MYKRDVCVVVNSIANVFGIAETFSMPGTMNGCGNCEIQCGLQLMNIAVQDPHFM